MANRIIDYISGKEVNATPEEIEAVQPFSKILVEDYNYPKENIKTHPQFRVHRCPSDKKGYPVDIAVFETNNNIPKIIVECKKSTVDISDTKQLEIYLSLSGAEIGVMYNGKNSIYVRRINSHDGSGDKFELLPSIPRYNENLFSIGCYKKTDLIPTHNLKSIFSEIRGWIVGNGNITRDEIIAEQMILLILCKIYDERFTPLGIPLLFTASLADSDSEIETKIHKLFKATSAKYGDVILTEDKIKFDGKTLRGVIGRLQKFSIIDTNRDCMADAFEIFVGKSVKEKEGQFFTPRNVIKIMINAIELKMNNTILDSACGSGGFLVEALKYIEHLVDELGNNS